ncbi:MAG TPA: hypothetical protein VEU47_13505 [Candidatus Cybelea sp.]|nr:hypothetical protein [Candidatus Cybelea sp.]
MADLTAAARRAIPASQYGLPEQRKYPMPDKVHARVAKSYASKEERAGVITQGQKAQIDRKADAKLGHPPRDHALVMASADHLHRMGHISADQHRQIRAKAQAQMNASKGAARPFGAIG